MINRYVDYDNGSDTNDGSTSGTAWKTITKALTAAKTLNDDVTINIAPSTNSLSYKENTYVLDANWSHNITLLGTGSSVSDVVLKLASGSRILSFTGTLSYTVKFSNLTLDYADGAAGAPGQATLVNNSTNGTLHLDKCDIIKLGTNAPRYHIIIGSSGNTPNLILTNTVSFSGNSLSSVIWFNSDIGNINLSNSTITYSGGNRFIEFGSGTTDISIGSFTADGMSFNGTNSQMFLAATDTNNLRSVLNGTISITNSTINAIGFLVIRKGAGAATSSPVIFTGNTCYRTSTFDTAFAYGGAFSDSNSNSNTWLGNLVFQNNIIKSNGTSTAKNLIEIGGGVKTADISNNLIVSDPSESQTSNIFRVLSIAETLGDIRIYNNKIYGPNGLYLQGSVKILCDYNTIYATLNAMNCKEDALSAQDPHENLIRNNIFITKENYCYSISYTAFQNQNPNGVYDYCIVDYNLLYLAGSPLGYAKWEGNPIITKNTTATISEIQSVWSANSTSAPEINNDINSIIGNPLLYQTSNLDPTTWDWTPSISSPAVGASSDGTTIGAVQVQNPYTSIYTAPGSYINRTLKMGTTGYNMGSSESANDLAVMGRNAGAMLIASNVRNSATLKANLSSMLSSAQSVGSTPTKIYQYNMFSVGPSSGGSDFYDTYIRTASPPLSFAQKKKYYLVSNTNNNENDLVYRSDTGSIGRGYSPSTSLALHASSANTGNGVITRGSDNYYTDPTVTRLYKLVITNSQTDPNGNVVSFDINWSIYTTSSFIDNGDAGPYIETGSFESSGTLTGINASNKTNVLLDATNGKGVTLSFDQIIGFPTVNNDDTFYLICRGWAFRRYYLNIFNKEALYDAINGNGLVNYMIDTEGIFASSGLTLSGFFLDNVFTSIIQPYTDGEQTPTNVVVPDTVNSSNAVIQNYTNGMVITNAIYLETMTKALEYVRSQLQANGSNLKIIGNLTNSRAVWRDPARQSNYKLLMDSLDIWFSENFWAYSTINFNIKRGWNTNSDQDQSSTKEMLDYVRDTGITNFWSGYSQRRDFRIIPSGQHWFSTNHTFPAFWESFSAAFHLLWHRDGDIFGYAQFPKNGLENALGSMGLPCDNSNYNIDLGNAKGNYTTNTDVNGHTYYMRKFTKGVVVMNLGTGGTATTYDSSKDVYISVGELGFPASDLQEPMTGNYLPQVQITEYAEASETPTIYSSQQTIKMTTYSGTISLYLPDRSGIVLLYNPISNTGMVGSNF